VVRMKTLARAGAALAALAASIVLISCEDSLLLNSLKMEKHRTVILTDSVISDISMATDNAGNGNVYVAWKNATKQVKFMRSLDKGATWDPAVTADAALGVAGRTRITGGGLNSIALVHKSGTKLRCTTSADNGTNWAPADISITTTATLNYDDSVNNFSMATLPVTAKPVLIYNNALGALRAFTLSTFATPWTWDPYITGYNEIGSLAGDGTYGTGNSLVAGPTANKLYAGYLANRSAGGSVRTAYFEASWASTSIQARGTETPNGDTAIGFGNGKVYLAYAWEPSHAIWIAQAADLFAPSPPLLDIYTGTGPISSIRITVPGDVYVAFYDKGTASIMLIYSKDQGTTWSAPVTIEEGLEAQEFGFLRLAIPNDAAGGFAVDFVYKATSSDGVSQDLVFTRINMADLP
jgi:hypothetical protein